MPPILTAVDVGNKNNHYSTNLCASREKDGVKKPPTNERIRVQRTGENKMENYGLMKAKQERPFMPSRNPPSPRTGMPCTCYQPKATQSNGNQRRGLRPCSGFVRLFHTEIYFIFSANIIFCKNFVNMHCKCMT